MPFSGTVAIRAMKDGDYQATIFPGTVAGLQGSVDFLKPTGGKIKVGPGTIACGTTGLTLDGMSGALSIVIEGCGERATILDYDGSGDFVTIGADDGNHSGSAAAYNGTGPQCKLLDIQLAGPGIGSSARGIVDWENGSSVYERVFFNNWGVGYFGIGADVSKFRDCLFNLCDKGVFLASRCDQNIFDSCYFTSCTIGANVEYAWGALFNGCKFVFSTVADIRYDAPASPTEGGDERLDIASTIDACWFESSSSPQLPRHIWCGSNGTSTRRVEGINVYGGYVLCSNTLNFVDVEASSRVNIDKVYQGGTLSGSLANIVTVSGLTPIVTLDESRNNGGALLGGNLGASQTIRNGIGRTSSNAFAASFTPNALGGEIVEIGALTNNITINAPTNPFRGLKLLFRFVQDGTGGRTVSWNAVFKHAWSDTGNTASKRSTISFYYDGTNWTQEGAQSPYI